MISDKRERWGRPIPNFFADKGGRGGGLDPPFLADIICEQLLICFENSKEIMNFNSSVVVTALIVVTFYSPKNSQIVNPLVGPL